MGKAVDCVFSHARGRHARATRVSGRKVQVRPFGGRNRAVKISEGAAVATSWSLSLFRFRLVPDAVLRVVPLAGVRIDLCTSDGGGDCMTSHHERNGIGDLKAVAIERKG